MAAEPPEEEDYAPWLDVQHTALTVVEHPGIVRNIDKTIASLGGDAKIAHALHPEGAFRLSLRPEDAFCRPLTSRRIQSSNLALRITVPRRTGRKRKRGSSDPFAHHDDGDDPSHLPRNDVRALTQSLRDNCNRFSVRAVGSIGGICRFRTLPDFQFSAATNPLVKNMKDTLLTFQYDRLKDFKIDKKSMGSRSNEDMIPPPMFTKMLMPSSYGYRQPATRRRAPGELRTTQHARDQQEYTPPYLFNPRDAAVPNNPPPELVPEEALGERTRNSIRQLRQLMDERPICSRIYLRAHMASENAIRNAVPYVAYVMRVGPWTEMYAKYGLDPRSDPKWRKYQSLNFRILQKEVAKDQISETRPSNPFEFDGNSVDPATRTYQICDITDPLLQPCLEEGPRSRCDVNHFGWIKASALLKLRLIMRDKMSVIMAGGTVDNDTYKLVCEVPNDIDQDNLDRFTDSKLPTSATAKEKAMLGELKRMLRQLLIHDGPYEVSSRQHIADGVDGSVVNPEPAALQDRSRAEEQEMTR